MATRRRRSDASGATWTCIWSTAAELHSAPDHRGPTHTPSSDTTGPTPARPNRLRRVTLATRRSRSRTRAMMGRARGSAPSFSRRTPTVSTSAATAVRTKVNRPSRRAALERGRGGDVSTNTWCQHTPACGALPCAPDSLTRGEPAEIPEEDGPYPSGIAPCLSDRRRGVGKELRSNGETISSDGSEVGGVARCVVPAMGERGSTPTRTRRPRRPRGRGIDETDGRRNGPRRGGSPAVPKPSSAAAASDGQGRTRSTVPGENGCAIETESHNSPANPPLRPTGDRSG